MGHEIDFLAVGQESKSGDAIALRYGNLFGNRDEQTVIIIDGGFTDDGDRLVNHVKHYFQTERVDIVISTHPDRDHVCGLKVVLERMEVGQLWMHQPWRHSDQLATAKRAGFRTIQLSQPLRESLEGAEELEAVANRLGIPIVEPFQDVASLDGVFRVLGPTVDFYEARLAEIKAEADLRAKAIAEVLRKMAEAAAKLVPESLWIETLTDAGETSPQNNTSAICLLTVEDRPCLFTGDAGMPALEIAADRLQADGFKAGQLSFVQIPHHGSRRNVGPTILDRLLGPKGQESAGTAFVSAAPKAAPKHPAKKVTNAFWRRGYKPLATQGRAKWHYRQAPDRPDYVAVEPLPLYAWVEEDEG